MMATVLPDLFSPVWTPSEAADYLRVSVNTVHELCRTRQLRATRVGRQWRILKTDLDAYLGIRDAGQQEKGR